MLPSGGALPLPTTLAGRPCSLVAALVLIVSPALAQPAALAVTPDTLLWWPWSQQPFVIENVGSDTLSLDSIDVGICSRTWCTEQGPAYGLRLAHRGEFYYGQIWRSSNVELYDWDGQPTFPELELAPGELAHLVVEYVDTCPICRSDASDTWTPFFFWAGLHPDSLVRTLAFEWPVVQEEPSSERLPTLDHSGPNPFREGTTLTLRGVDAIRVDLYDVFGRRIRQLFEGETGEPISIVISGEGLSPGPYFVVATSGRAGTTATLPLLLLR
jgi:hypothetical protein